MSSTATPGMGRVMNDAGIFADDDRRSDTGADAYDALRDLFLGDEDATAPPAPIVEAAATAASPVPEPDPGLLPAPDFPKVDALILGHLPVLQSAWVMQYAREAAAHRGGPVALLRVRADEVTLDLVGSSGAPIPATQQASFDDALSEAAPLARGLIVRVDATSEPLLAELKSIDCVTLLTGADEVAILAAYTTVKKLLVAPEDTGPVARLAIMGSTPEKALQAASKLERTAAMHLQRTVSVTACVSRIGPGRSALLYRGPMVGTLEEVLAKSREAMNKPRRSPRAVPATHSPQRRPIQDDERRIDAVPSAPRPQSTEHIAPLVEAAPPVVSRLGHAAVGPASDPAPAVLAQRPIALDLSQSPHPLHSHIRGLTGTPRIACPTEPRIELAVDSRGGLHLLAHADAPGTLGQSLASLLSVRNWASVHAALVSLAMQGLGIPFDLQKPPVLHLLTSDIKETRGLADAGLHIHLLARVEIEGRQGWFCTEVS